VPRITAATVAEHRARQRATIVEAALDLLLDGGYPALSFGTVAQRAELARPSVYSYFKSKDDMVVAACEELMPRFMDRINRSMARARTPRSRLAAFVRAQLEGVGAGEHRLALVLERAPLSADARARITVLHQRFAPGITDVLRDLGSPHPELAAELVQGVVTAGMRRIDAGETPSRVIRLATDLVLRGLSGPH
jgi:AcrR family transcriptional regulator